MEPEPAHSPFHPPQSLLFAPSSYLFSDLAPFSPPLCVSLLLSPSLPSSDSVLSPTHRSVPGTVPRALDPGKAVKQPSCLLQAYPFPYSREPGVGGGGAVEGCQPAGGCWRTWVGHTGHITPPLRMPTAPGEETPEDLDRRQLEARLGQLGGALARVTHKVEMKMPLHPFSLTCFPSCPSLFLSLFLLSFIL